MVRKNPFISHLFSKKINNTTTFGGFETLLVWGLIGHIGAVIFALEIAAPICPIKSMCPMCLIHHQLLSRARLIIKMQMYQIETFHDLGHLHLKTAIFACVKRRVNQFTQQIINL